MIRQPNKIKNFIEKNGVSYYTLETDSYLEESFTELPHGIINKTETGIGATTLELNAKRNSIIVEPIKITASSKAHKFNALYIGSETRFHKQTTKAQIRDYLADDAIAYKKIVVVADSLKKLDAYFKKGLLKDFFLMIDEVDSFQNDSKFRYSMEQCMDIYKAVPLQQRALVTATLQPFSDPILIAETKTIIQLETPKTRQIKVIHTNNLHGSAIDNIKKQLKSNPGEKIMVAYNSVSGCYDIAQNLVDDGIVLADRIKILCSKNNEETVKQYYHELDSDKLPAQLNFVTSAYFSGFDIHERFHLVSISKGNSNIYALSEHKLKQIAGRCRDKQKLFSETILYAANDFNESAKKTTPEELIEAAESEIKALECLSRNFERNAILSNQLEKIRQTIIADTKFSGYGLLRHDIDLKTTIAYLSIDAAVESSRVIVDLYNGKTLLPEILKNEGNDITFLDENSLTKVPKQNIEVLESQGITDKLLEGLEHCHSDHEIIDVSDQLTGLKKIHMAIIGIFIDNYLRVDRDQLLQHLRKGGNQKDLRYLRRLKLSLIFTTLQNTNFYKRTVFNYLQIGKEYTPMELLQKWNKIFQELGFQKRLRVTADAVKITKKHFETVKTRKPSFKIISDNPFKVTVTSHLPDESPPSLHDLLG